MVCNRTDAESSTSESPRIDAVVIFNTPSTQVHQNETSVTLPVLGLSAVSVLTLSLITFPIRSASLERKRESELRKSRDLREPPAVT